MPAQRPEHDLEPARQPFERIEEAKGLPVRIGRAPCAAAAARLRTGPAMRIAAPCLIT